MLGLGVEPNQAGARDFALNYLPNLVGKKVKVLVTQSCLTLGTPWTITLQAPLPWDSPGKNTGISCHFLLQGIFLTQELNRSLLLCRQILYQLS